MLERSILLCLTAITMLCIATANSSDKTIVKATSIAGEVINLTGPIEGDWKFSTDEFKIDFAVEAIKKIARTSEGKIRLTLIDGQIIEAIAPQDGKITGEGEWGEVQLPWRQIKSAQIIPSTNLSSSQLDQSKKKSVQWKIISSSGTAVELYDLHQLYSTTLEFQMQGFIIYVDTLRLQSIDQTVDGNFTVSLVDGKSFNGTLKDRNDTINGQGPYGVVSIPFVKITKILNTSQLLDGNTQNKQIKEASSIDVPDDHLTVESIFGTTVPAWELVPNGVKVSGLDVKMINWSGVRFVTAESQELKLQADDGNVFILNGGSLTGQTMLGRFQIPLQFLAHVETNRLLAPSQKSPPKRVATVQLANGQSLSVQGLDLSGVDDHTSWLNGFCELKRLGLRYWISKDVILMNGLKMQYGRLVANINGTPGDFDPSDSTLTIYTDAITLSGKLADMLEVTPITSTKPSYEKEVEPPSTTGVDVQLSDGKIEKFSAADMWFANYPETAWSGMYYLSEWPFQWWRNKQLDVKNSDGSIIKINIEKISKITVNGQYSGKLTFKSTAGSELTGDHVREGLNMDAKQKGPTKWELDKEGVLILVNKDLFVFVPFVAIDHIAFINSLPK